MTGVVSWFGVNLEPIMMAALLISMGFSVDIPAHVAYHYNVAGKFSNFFLFLVNLSKLSEIRLKKNYNLILIRILIILII